MAEGNESSGLSGQEVLLQVEEMATKLLEEEDVPVLVEICKRVIVCGFAHQSFRPFPPSAVDKWCV